MKVDWYYNVSPEPAPAAAAGTAASLAKAGAPAGPAEFRRTQSSPGRDVWADGSPARAATAAAAAALGLAAALLAATRRRRSPAATAAEPAQAAQAGESPTAGVPIPPAGQGQAEDPLAELQRNSAEDLHALLQGEHPQTIALILAHVPEETAAAVLGGFSRDRQVEVSRRIAEMSPVARQVVGEVLRGLLSHGPARAPPPAAGRAAESARSPRSSTTPATPRKRPSWTA